MEVEEYIHQKVKIFKNKTYFHLFQTILINLSKNVRIYRKKYSLSGNLENNLNKNKNEKSSVWFYIMKIVLDKLKEKEKAFFPKNNLDVNPLVFSYLVKLCKNKMAKLEKLSIIENAPMDNLIRLYLDLCQKEINPEIPEKKEEKKKSISNLKDYINNNKALAKNMNQAKNTQQKKEVKEDEEDSNENVTKKYGIGKLKLKYNKSLCRLFIGDTDEKSVQKKYLMSITVKKDRTLKINGQPIGKSESYARRIINEIGEEKGYYIDDDLNKIINKFKREQKFLDDYRKNLKLEQNENIKKLSTNNKYNKKSLKIINLKSTQDMTKSPSQIYDFKNYMTIKKKSRNFNLMEYYTNNINKQKNIKNDFKSLSNPHIYHRKIIFSGFGGKRKISKALLSKFKKFKANKTIDVENKVNFHDYMMNKNDFFFNNEFDIKLK